VRGRRRPRQTRSSEAILELDIDELAAGGDGVGRAADGRVVFVPFTAPGDRVRVRVEGDRGRFLRARVVELLRASPRRTDPVCAVFGSCGGCSWQHIDYAAQLEAKSKIVSDAFARIGGITASDRVPVTPSPSAYGYRSRARVLVERGRVGFRRRHSHALCATSRCPILAPPLQTKLAELSRRPPPTDGEWELFWGDGGARAAALHASSEERVEVRVGCERVGISPGVFAQSNTLLLETLADSVLAAAGQGALAFDLFAGAGFFTLGLARRFERVTGLESSPAAARDLAANLRAAGIANATMVPERLEAAVAGGLFDSLEPDVVVLDPPRTGLPPGSSDALAELGPRRIVYLSCNPATQARDAAYLVGGGYSAVRVEAFDLFPQTPHVESLAVFERVS
jgi:tRNA/tmRNA/rRNA uracil-C5-methylase (TrmA/RlmC/RlmD family)